MNQNFHDPDWDLMAELKSGNDDALGSLMDKHKKNILNLAYKFLGDRHEAEDLAQEVFVKVYENKDRYRPDFKFSTWLFSIAKNLCINRAKYLKRREAYSIDEDIEAEDGEIKREFADENVVQADEALLNEELTQKVKEALGSLPDNYRLPMVMAKYQDLPYDEIAKILKCSVTAVKLRILRAKEMLREKLKNYV
jgi:RNA polymerase sigma-70 factor (ECF subfamily)